MGKMDALNRAFEKAFAHTATKETLMDLLSCLGEELSCDRISIFEFNADNTCDNTYEWCSRGTPEEGELSLVQINDQYTRLTGIRSDQSEKMEHFTGKYLSRQTGEIAAIFHRADNHPMEGASGYFELTREDGAKVPVDLRIFLLYSGKDYRLYLCTMSESNRMIGKKD